MYAKQLQKRGHEVTIVSFSPYVLSLRQNIKQLLWGRNFFKANQSIASYSYPERLNHRLIYHFPPLKPRDVPDGDIVIATWWETAEWVAKLPDRKGVKVYFVQNHETFDYFTESRVQATYHLPMPKITIAAWLQDLLFHKYEGSHVFLIPNSVDTTLFHASPRSRNPIPTIGMLYAQPYWKGCDLSLEAFAIAAQSIPNLRLIAFGTTDPLPELPLPANTQYFKTPPQTSLKHIYSQCDAWLFSSRTEGFGLPILEAMACRTPVIGTPAGAAPELLAEGGGILVPPEDPQAMAAAIVKLMGCPETEWQQMSDRAYRQATSYTWEEATDRFEAALQTILKNSAQ